MEDPIYSKGKQKQAMRMEKGNCVAYIDARDCMDTLDMYYEEWWQNEF